MNVRAPDVARRDFPTSLVFHGNPPVGKMLEDLVARGAKVLVCPSCAEVMGVKKTDLIDGAEFATKESLFGALGPNTAVFTY